MVTFSNPPMAVITMLFIVALFLPYLHSTEAQVGVCYGKFGSDLPSAEQVVKLYKDNSISAMRLYEPDVPTLEALRGSDIKLMLGVLNADIEKIGCYQSAADEWVQKFVTPYAESIKYIAVGNEIKPSGSEAQYVKRAMENILNALNNSPDQQLQSCDIKVSTAISTDLIKNKEKAPPSEAEFIDTGYIGPIIEFLAENDSPLLANIQPYLAYQRDHFNLSYLIFTAGDSVFVEDTNNQLVYHNVFDAILDSVYAAVGKVGTAAQTEARNGDGGGVTVASSETGASSGKFKGVSRDNLSRRRQNGGMLQQGGVIGLPNSDANAFYANLIEHVKGGTPLKPGKPIETYLFAMFDENLKDGGDTEKFYGLFTADGTPKYQHPCLKFN